MKAFPSSGLKLEPSIICRPSMYSRHKIKTWGHRFRRSTMKTLESQALHIDQTHKLTSLCSQLWIKVYIEAKSQHSRSSCWSIKKISNCSNRSSFRWFKMYSTPSRLKNARQLLSAPITKRLGPSRCVMVAIRSHSRDILLSTQSTVVVLTRTCCKAACPSIIPERTGFITIRLWPSLSRP